jgi:hypothetical protein
MLSAVKSFFLNYRSFVKVVQPSRILRGENELRTAPNSRLVDLEANIVENCNYDARIIIFGYDTKVREKINEKGSIFNSTLFKIAFYSSLVGNSESFAQVLPEEKTIVAAVPIDEFLIEDKSQKEITKLAKLSDFNRAVRQSLQL